jgi:hypothetical protein
MPSKKDNFWLMPPRIKILEALGTIADKRIEISGNRAKVTSSMHEKTYAVTFDGKDSITCNDNGSYYKGYLGYPSIAFLMLKGILSYDEKIADSLKGIKWKDLNEKFKDYSKVEQIIKIKAARQKIKQNQIDEFISKVLGKLKELELKKLE